MKLWALLLLAVSAGAVDWEVQRPRLVRELERNLGDEWIMERVGAGPVVARRGEARLTVSELIVFPDPGQRFAAFQGQARGARRAGKRASFEKSLRSDGALLGVLSVRDERGGTYDGILFFRDAAYEFSLSRGRGRDWKALRGALGSLRGEPILVEGAPDLEASWKALSSASGGAPGAARRGAALGGLILGAMLLLVPLAVGMVGVGGFYWFFTEKKPGVDYRGVD